VSGAEVGPPETNLAVRAAKAVLDTLEHRFAVHLTLDKRIPVGAGLGGGSADAAAALLAVNRLASDAVPRHELLQFAARLGSDIPFCLSGAPLALGWGRGERLLRLPGLPAAPGLVVSPSIAIATAEAYRWVDAARESAGRRGALALDLDALSRWGDIARMAGNDFESPVFARHPEIRSAFEALVATHPVVCRMSGSGSSLLAIYRHARDREDARLRLGRKHGAVIAIETLAHATAGPELRE
jgi:4-diphosphocytidyl-2-C-methyl-D-erythritol kinase